MLTMGERIKKRRLELNLTQEELATKLGYKSRSSINKIELDLVLPNQRKISSFAKALETSPGYIMGWKEENTTDYVVIIEAINNRPELKALFEVTRNIKASDIEALTDIAKRLQFYDEELNKEGKR